MWPRGRCGRRKVSHGGRFVTRSGHWAIGPEGRAMLYQEPRAARWLRGTNTMLGQVRTLFLGFLVIWPVFGLWGIRTGAGIRTVVLAIGAVVIVEIWLYAGYRRQRFPAWSWIFEGLCILLAAGASNFGATVGLLFMWVNF